MCIVFITRGSTYFAAVPLPVHLGRGRAERRQGSRVRQGREKMKQRGRKNEGENNKEETEDEHGKGRGCQTQCKPCGMESIFGWGWGCAKVGNGKMTRKMQVQGGENITAQDEDASWKGNKYVLSSIRHVSCILREGAGIVPPFQCWTGTGMK